MPLSIQLWLTLIKSLVWNFFVDNKMEHIRLLLICIIIGISSIYPVNSFGQEIIHGKSLVNQILIAQKRQTLSTLELFDNGQVNIEPRNFTRFKNLKELAMMNNNLTIIPLGIFNGLNRLDKLIIRNEPKVTTLAINLFNQLKNLVELDLSGNGLINLNPGVFNGLEKLNNLKLSENKLTNLKPGIVRGLKNLTRLDLSENNITVLESGIFDGLFDADNPVNSTNISRSKRRKSDLSILLNYNNIEYIHNYTFRGLILNRLNFEGNQISEIIPGIFSGLRVKNLDLSSNKLIRIKSEAFKGISGIQSLDLTHNQLFYLQPGFCNGLENQENIKLNLNLAYNKITSILNGTFNKLNLRKLKLHNNRISDIEVGAFSELKVWKLDLSENSLTNIKFGVFNDVKSIRELILSQNNLTYLEHEFFNGLENPGNMLLTLKLGGNLISNIKNGTFNGLSLDRLDLHGNQIYQIGPGVFSGLIVEKLNLCNNKLTTITSGAFEGIIDISELLLSGNKIKYIEPGFFNELSNRMNLHLILKLEKNNPLTDVRYNNVVFTILSSDSLGNRNHKTRPGNFSGLNVTWASCKYSESTLAFEAFEEFNEKSESEIEDCKINRIEWEETDDDIPDEKMGPLYAVFENRPVINQTSFSEYESTISHLELYGNKKVSIGPQNFTKFNHLVELVLTGNNLTSLQSGFFNGLNQLEILIIKNEPNLTILDGNLFNGLGNLIQLELSDIGITKLEHGLFRHLKNLRTLDLSKNNLMDLKPGTFKNLRCLSNINLSRNNFIELKIGIFAGIGDINYPLDTKIIESIRKKKNFVLRLDSNKIQSIGKHIFNDLILKALVIKSNEITEIKRGAFSGLIVERLDLSDNKLSTIQAGTFDKIAFIKYLDLSGNQLTYLEPGFFIGLEKQDPFTLALRGNHIFRIQNKTFRGLNLKVLNLENNKISEIEADAFLDLEVGVLDLSENKLINITASAFNGIDGIKQLDLSQNEISYLEPGFLDELKKINYLDLSMNNLSNLELDVFKGLGDLEEPSNFIDEEEFLQSYFYSGVQFQYNNISSIPRNTFKEMNVPLLDLSNNIISKIERGAFSDLKVGRLDLSKNKLTDIEPGTFLGILSIAELSLSRNNLIALEPGFLNGLSDPRRFYFSLKLEENEITKIRTNTFNGLYLKELDLHGNLISKIEPEAFSGLNVTNLDLSNNKLTLMKADGFDGIINIYELKVSMKNLTYIEHGFFNDVTNRGNLQFVLKLEENDIFTNVRYDTKKGFMFTRQGNSHIRPGPPSGLKITWGNSCEYETPIPIFDLVDDNNICMLSRIKWE